MLLEALLPSHHLKWEGGSCPVGGGHCLFFFFFFFFNSFILPDKKKVYTCFHTVKKEYFRYPLSNYHPCFSALSAPQSFFLPTPNFEGHRPPPPPPKKKSNILNTKLSTNVIQSLLNGFLYKECHVADKIEGIQT